MNFKAFYDKIVDLIYGNRRNIMRVSFSALALLLLIIVLFFSSDNFNINSEVDTLIKYIDGRQYTMAETYFDDIEKEFKKAHLHLDYDMLHRDAYTPETMQKIQDDIQETFERGVNGTPAIEINGVLYMGAMPYDDLIEKIKLAQKRALN